MAKRHKPTSLKYNVHRLSDYKKITDAPKTKAFVYMNLVAAVKTAVEGEMESVDLFKLEGCNASLVLPKAVWKPSLTKAMEFFTEKEMFETCIECKRLIDLI